VQTLTTKQQVTNSRDVAILIIFSSMSGCGNNIPACPVTGTCFCWLLLKVQPLATKQQVTNSRDVAILIIF
jgi:hypothetical protein